MIQPEQYNEFGDIIEVKPPRTYERNMTTYDTHRIHETKDLTDSNCTYCQAHAKKVRKYWENQENIIY